MKKILTVLLLFALQSLNAQTDSSLLKFNESGDSTGFGDPDGKPVSKEITVAGGTILSEDGRVELIFPEGALTVNTNISIQPTTNLLNSGTGKAYKFEPSGIQFKKPVQIIFHYTKEESETCPADLMNIAMQDQNGKWSFDKYEEWDSTTNTLKGFIHHFSYYANSNGARISPAKNFIIVESNVNINFYDRYGIVQSGPLIGNSDRLSVGSRYWVVNGVREGSDVEGFATAPPIGTSLGVYTAPKIMPPKNPVVIHLFFEYYSEILMKEVWGVVSCKILVYDEYKIEINHEYTGRASMHSKIGDKGTFVVRVSPNRNFRISEIKNYEPVVIKEGRNGPFKEKVFTDGYPGTIHITDSHLSDSLSHDYPPEVYFEFAPKEIVMCEIQHNARGIYGERGPVTFMRVPEEINFIANGQKQRYNITIGRGETYKLIVTPHGRGNQ